MRLAVECACALMASTRHTGDLLQSRVDGQEEQAIQGVRRGRSRLPERLQADAILAVAAGGALGAPTRYGVAQIVGSGGTGFPWATLWTNLSGALALGFFLTLVLERLPPTRLLRRFFTVGFLGSYTTFSTLAVEAALLVRDGHVALGIGYTLASVSAGLALAYVGIVLARLLPGGEYR